jgi:hypothetical protein
MAGITKKDGVTEVKSHLNARRQSYDFGIYNHNASFVCVVCSGLERFSQQEKLFLFTKRTSLLVA